MTRAPGELPAAVSLRMAAALAAPPRPVTVLAAFPTVVYLRLDRHDKVLPVLARDALVLPTGLRLAEDSVTWGVEAGGRAVVGGGRVVLGEQTLVVVRSWRPKPVQVFDRPAIQAPATWADLVSASLREAATEVVADAVRGRPLQRGVHDLVGAGAGLTPSGDDALCGAMLVLRAAGSPAAAHLASAVAERLGATTSLSASLLREAMEGYAVPAVVRLVSAGVGGRAAERESALADVLPIGHTSGADLATGVLAALDVLSRNASPSAPPGRAPLGVRDLGTATGPDATAAPPLPLGAVHD